MSTDRFNIKLDVIYALILQAFIHKMNYKLYMTELDGCGF